MRYPAWVTTEDNARIVLFPDCLGCQTQVDGDGDLHAVAEEALAGWLEVHLQAGPPPPRPSPRPRSGKRGKLIWIDVSARLAIKLALRWARQEAGLSRTQLARLSGLDPLEVEQIENPDVNPTIDALEMVAHALGVRLHIDLEPRAMRHRPLTKASHSRLQRRVSPRSRARPGSQPKR